MARTRDLTVGLAELLHDLEVGVWQPDGIFPPGATGITTKVMPASPDRVVAIGPYTVADLVEGHRVQGLQIRTRGAPSDPLDVDDLDDLLYHHLHGREDLVLGGVKIHKLYRVSHGTLGQDADYRTENSANYYALVDAPALGTR